MGLFQKAIETYDCMKSIVGVEQDNKATLAPIGFISTKAQILITLDGSGNFVNAERIYDIKTDAKGKQVKNDKIIIIPVMEKSSGRTSSASTTPHPLMDKLMYMCPENTDSYHAYLDQLGEWCDSAYAVREIRAVMSYVSRGTIRDDLSTLDKVTDDMFVCWKVLSAGTNDYEELWRNKSVIDSFVSFCTKKVEDTSDKWLCYVEGEVLPSAEQHLKGVVAFSGSAKLISANDKENYTYRGRFLDDKEASGMSYIASQKAHNALKWIVANDGVRFGDRSIVCWNPKGRKAPKPTETLFGVLKRDNETVTPTNYRDALGKVIAGYKSELLLDDETVTAVFEAATTGRLSVSYYSEMKAYDYLDRLKAWDESTAWVDSFGRVYSPSLRRMVDTAYGTLRSSQNMQSIETDEKIVSETMSRLLICRLERAQLPVNVMRAAVAKCEKLQLYDNVKGNYLRDELLFTTCAIIKKYKKDYFGEEWGMALEPEKKNRSYQYGRLLAVMEKAERDTYDNAEKRETNAIRLQSFFVKRPLQTTATVMEQIKNAYYPRLSVGARKYYESLIEEIMLALSECEDFGEDKPLSEEYLVGYYLQKNAFYSKKNNDNNKNNETEENEQ